MKSNLYSARLSISLAETQHMPMEAIRSEMAKSMISEIIYRLKSELPLEELERTEFQTVYESRIMVMTQQDYNKSIFDAEARGRQAEANDTDRVIKKLSSELEKQDERMRKILSAISDIITKDSDVVNDLLGKLKEAKDGL